LTLGGWRNKRRPAGLASGGETFRHELLARARTLAGEDRVANLKIETVGQNDFKLE
jgi:hypothetical protein